MPVVTVEIEPEEGRSLLIAPGLSTPHGILTGVEVSGAEVRKLTEAATEQTAIVASCRTEPIVVRYIYADDGAPYPAAMFTPRPSRFSRAADAVLADAQGFAGASDATAAIVNHVAGLFSYGHPDTRYYDDHDQIPQICDLTQGSCVDINFYLIASLRAVGVTTGYALGPFFPAEKTDADGNAWCDDMHCWVVTRDAFGEREWDIAHHLKLGAERVEAGLNPKQGKRFAVSHSMGLSLPEFDLFDFKLMSEPMWLRAGECDQARLSIRCTA